MNTFSKHSRLLIVVLLLGLVGQWVYAQDGTNTPQWIIDRQQYETTFVPISQPSQWVVDRQQYETTFVPISQPVDIVPLTPQWIIDRQQYETTFVPISQPMDIVPQMPQWVIDRQQYETTFAYPIGDFPTTTTVLAASAR